ncbi:MAG TPA: hypothetical protein VK272_00930 [Solirubrobacteraceae bacterium]|nr:hypothetical protein [Solirubrobacteraceae bacterium]
MFPPRTSSKLAQRTLDALRVARSFLLLEDDHSIDWEVDQDEHARASHPHRAPLRGRRVARRPGAVAPVCHVCLCPVERGGTLHQRAGAREGHATGGPVRARSVCAAAGCDTGERHSQHRPAS